MSIQPPWGVVPKNGRPPVIVVHAITGSALVDEYPLPAEVGNELATAATHTASCRTRTSARYPAGYRVRRRLFSAL
jgi:hypothetical protein